jgi:hypothetical protein
MSTSKAEDQVPSSRGQVRAQWPVASGMGMADIQVLVKQRLDGREGSQNNHNILTDAENEKSPVEIPSRRRWVHPCPLSAVRCPPCPVLRPPTSVFPDFTRTRHPSREYLDSLIHDM